MADNSVFITGTASGAFTEALSDLPPWATEHTAGQIEKHLKKNLNIQTQALRDLVRAAKGRNGSGSVMDSTNANKLNSELDKLIRNLKKQNNDAAKSKKRRKDRDKEDDNSLLGIRRFNSGADKARFVFAAVAAVGEQMLKVDKQYIKTSDELYKSGLNVLNGNNETTSGLASLNNAVVLTGLRLETLQDVAQKYATSINAYGFTKFTKSLAQATTQLKEMGYSSKESAVLMGSYTETAQNYSDLRRRSEKELADDAIKFGNNITKLSLAMGISREQLLNNTKAISKSSDVALIYAKYGKEGADKLLAFAASFPDQELGKQLVTMSADTVPALNATFQDLAKSGLGGFAEQLNRITRQAPEVDPKETRLRIARLLETVPDSTRQFLRLQAQAGNASAAHTQEILNNLSQAGRGISEATDAQVNNATKTESVIAKFQTETERLSASLQAAFPPLKSQIVALTSGMELLNDAIYGVINNTNTETRSWLGAGTIIAGFLAGTLLPLVGKAGSVLGLLKGTAGATGVAGAGAGAAAGGAGTAAMWGAGGIAAGAGGYLIGDKIVKPMIDGIISAATGSQDTLGGWIYDVTHKSQISVPKTPAPSTINSPSAVPANSQAKNDAAGAKTSPSASPVGPGIEKAPVSVDINSTLTYQSNLLAQILQASENLISVNKDILRYTRNQT